MALSVLVVGYGCNITGDKLKLLNYLLNFLSTSELLASSHSIMIIIIINNNNKILIIILIFIFEVA